MFCEDEDGGWCDDVCEVIMKWICDLIGIDLTLSFSILDEKRKAFIYHYHIILLFKFAMKGMAILLLVASGQSMTTGTFTGPPLEGEILKPVDMGAPPIFKNKLRFQQTQNKLTTKLSPLQCSIYNQWGKIHRQIR